ncbi:MAG: arginine--tRNA ligase [Phycisphaerae bacterium]|nr:arginine--tRNA ligase [Phycisphaerae bacterium]
MTSQGIQETSEPALIIDQLLRTAFASVLDAPAAECDPVVRSSQNPEHGDYQANGAMAMAKKRGMNPRELAEQVIRCADLSEIAEKAEVAGPGFINITLHGRTLAHLLDTFGSSDLGIDAPAHDHPIAIDLCGVNIAKQMHVGHLRATIIGDTLARIFERLGWKVHRENHLGDWGLPIAMTLSRLKTDGIELDSITLEDLNAAYRDAQLSGRDDRAGLEAARRFECGPHRIAELQVQHDSAQEEIDRAKQTLIALQASDAGVVSDWKKIIDCTMREVYDACTTLNTKIGPEASRGESFYRDKLSGVVDEFVQKGLAREDDGAIVVDFEDRERPMLIRKSDGGYLYATTDLAALFYRIQELGSERVIYVVDARQRDHFKDVFDSIRLIGWDVLPDGTRSKMIHLPFGAVLGPDKKPLKTRSGENFTLEQLLQEAIDRGTGEVRTRAEDPNSPTHQFDEEQVRRIGQAVGIAAIKYADLSSDVVRDYVFDLDRMVAFEGNTGPYIQYAHARICSILEKAGAGALEGATFEIAEPQERQLALRILEYPRIVQEVAESLEPHRLCTYLYAVANDFSSFYQACPVLKAADEATRSSRLKFCDLVRRLLSDGLDLLGIEAPERM